MVDFNDRLVAMFAGNQQQVGPQFRTPGFFAGGIDGAGLANRIKAAQLGAGAPGMFDAALAPQQPMGFGGVDPMTQQVFQFAQRNGVSLSQAYGMLREMYQWAQQGMTQGFPFTPTGPVNWMAALQQAPGAQINPQSIATPQKMGFPLTAIAAGASVTVTARATKAFIAKKFEPNLTSAAITTTMEHVYITSFLISGETQLNGSDPVPLVSYRKLDEFDNFTGKAITPQSPVTLTLLNTGTDPVTFGGDLRGPTLDS